MSAREPDYRLIETALFRLLSEGHPCQEFRDVDGAKFGSFGDVDAIYREDETGEQIWLIGFHADVPQDDWDLLSGLVGSEAEAKEYLGVDMPRVFIEGDKERALADLALLILFDFRQIMPRNSSDATEQEIVEIRAELKRRADMESLRQKAKRERAQSGSGLV